MGPNNYVWVFGEEKFETLGEAIAVTVIATDLTLTTDTIVNYRGQKKSFTP